ncbi:MAG: ADP-glyceromanno-heptose 6-epimerase [Bacteroidia bacterium]
MIVITGAAGFIGSYVTGYLNQKNFYDLVLIDDFSRTEKQPNYQNKTYTALVPRQEALLFLQENAHRIQAILHLGARTDTTAKENAVFENLNLNYSKMLWNYAAENQIPFLYASSAATYGDGQLGFSDDPALLPRLKPLNPYAQSKHDFDLWTFQQEKKPYFWAGFKFFNVYGPNEYHKGRMASVVYHGFYQIQKENTLRLFRSHRPDYADGEQKRDFIYVKDVAEVLFYFLTRRPTNGIFNLGTGKARSFNDLAHSLFNALHKPPHITYIDTPPDIRDTYQYFTQAEITRLRQAGYRQAFTSLEEGVQDYVQNYLLPGRYF